MGSGGSRDHSNTHLEWYGSAVQQPCLFPDVSVDETLMKFAGLNSNMELRQYSNQMVQNVPDYIDRLGSRLGTLNSVPNAVGLGALVLYLFMDLILNENNQQSQADQMYSMFRRVFAEEKASSVRDTMSEYVTRHQIHLHNEQRLLEELHRLETQLSNHLTILKNSMQYDNHMTTRAFKIWINGAAFHLQMLIHQARLKRLSGQTYSDSVRTIQLIIDRYIQSLNVLLDKYKSHVVAMTVIVPHHTKQYGRFGPLLYQIGCTITNRENFDCRTLHRNDHSYDDPCGRGDLVQSYVNHVFSIHLPLSSLTKHFSDIKQNLDALIKQHDAFNPAIAN